jgi:hypothetical protein
MAHVGTPPERCGFGDGVCCVVIALCAISGKPPEEIGKVLQQAAAECDDAISAELRKDHSPKHCCRRSRPWAVTTLEARPDHPILS